MSIVAPGADRRIWIMTHKHLSSETGGTTDPAGPVPQRPGSARLDGGRKRSPSMHEGIAVWCDCCSCEAEPYWVEIAQEMGIDLGSDYEDPAS